MGWLAHEGGAAAVEYAIVAPVFLMFVFGTLEAGRLIWLQVTLDRAVAMTARCAAVNTSVCGTTALMRTYAVAQAPGKAFPAATFSMTSTSSNVCVSAAYSFSFVATYIYGASKPLTAKACFPT